MKYILIILALSLVGCRGNYGLADGQVLCDTKGQAFYVTSGFGQTSFVERKANFDAMCEKTK